MLRLALVLFCLTSTVFADDAQKQFRDYMAAAAKLALTSGSQPYSAKWNYTACCLKTGGQYTGTLIVEYVRPDLWRTEINNAASYQRVQIDTKDALYLKSTFEITPWREMQMLDAVRRFEQIADEHVKQHKGRRIRDIEADCFTIESSSGSNTMYGGEYCFDPKRNVPVFAHFGGDDIDYLSFRQVGARTLPEHWEVRTHGRVAVSVQLADASDHAGNDAASLQPAPGSLRKDPAPTCGTPLESGMLTKKVVPVYPESAKRNRQAGVVMIGAIIDKLGHIRKLGVIGSSGTKELDQSALDAVQHWQYKPYMQCGQPQEVETLITVDYNMGSR
ncbi:MAG TPA: energy transducer TonB [Terriglobales bacterium]